jgi:hypothetical protein
MNNDLETILDVCLTQIEDDESTVDECLARYPEHAAELKPMLVAATRLSGVRDVSPSPLYKTRARAQLTTYMQQNPQRKRVSPVIWRLSISFVTMILLFIASGTAFAQQAVPGDTLYNWKLTSEHFWRLASIDQLGVDITLSNRRVSELMLVSGNEMRRDWAIEKYEELLVKFRNADATDRERILPVLRAQHERLVKAGVLIPELEDYFPR